MHPSRLPVSTGACQSDGEVNSSSMERTEAGESRDPCLLGRLDSAAVPPRHEASAPPPSSPRDGRVTRTSTGSRSSLMRQITTDTHREKLSHDLTQVLMGRLSHFFSFDSRT